MLVRKQVKSNRKDGVEPKIVFKTNKPYRVLEKDTPSSYWLQCFPFYEGLERHRRKVKESEASIEKILPNMVIHNHLDVQVFHHGRTIC